MSEAIDRAVAALPDYTVTGRNAARTKVPEWFVEDNNRPAGKFVAGPFESQEAADEALKIINVRAILAALREPTLSQSLQGQRALMAETGRACGADDADVVWRAMIDELLK